jgi:adenylate kinase
MSLGMNDTVDSVYLPSGLRTSKYNYSESPSASFVLDGFPRTATQASQIDELIPINMVVNINTPSDIIIDRICNRWVHAPSGRVYNTTFNKPKVEGKDDVTGDALTRRADDDPETWKARLKNFKETSQSLLEHYDKLGVLWTVNGNSSDEITPQLFKEFGKRFGALEN